MFQGRGSEKKVNWNEFFVADLNKTLNNLLIVSFRQINFYKNYWTILYEIAHFQFVLLIVAYNTILINIFFFERCYLFRAPIGKVHLVSNDLDIVIINLDFLLCINRSEHIAYLRDRLFRFLHKTSPYKTTAIQIQENPLISGKDFRIVCILF